MRKTTRSVVGLRLVGGLGNQLFEYAAALAVAERCGADIGVDTSPYAGDPARRPHLADFGLRPRKVSDPAKTNGLWEIGARLGLVPYPLRGAARFDEPGHFDPAFLNLTAPCYLAGHFQSWRYLVGHEAAVRQAFDLDRLATPRTAPIERRIAAASTPVAIHVRRGDYAQTAHSISMFGLLHAEYYRRARAELEQRLDVPTWFVFSDDMPAALAELGGWPNLVPVTGMSPTEDFRLMALCRHFIIANSTFSWWGAWLGRSPDKLVVTPDVWFGSTNRASVVIDDRLPPEWIRVDAGRTD